MNEEIFEKLEMSKTEVTELTLRDLRCPNCRFLIDKVYSDRRYITMEENKCIAHDRFRVTPTGRREPLAQGYGLYVPEPVVKLSDDHWTPETVAKILRNEKYIGDQLFQKYYTSDTMPFRELPNRGEHPQYYYKDRNEAIMIQADYLSDAEYISVLLKHPYL